MRKPWLFYLALSNLVIWLVLLGIYIADGDYRASDVGAVLGWAIVMLESS